MKVILTEDQQYILTHPLSFSLLDVVGKKRVNPKDIEIIENKNNVLITLKHVFFNNNYYDLYFAKDGENYTLEIKKFFTNDIIDSIQSTSLDKVLIFLENFIDNLYLQNEGKGARCTKITKKASSYLKNKKWMKCIKNPDGEGYVRRHWGDPNAKVTGKSGNTKRKKAFRARHGCSTAKPGTPKYLACKDW